MLTHAIKKLAETTPGFRVFLVPLLKTAAGVVVLRPEGQRATSDEAYEFLSHLGKGRNTVWRGMTEVEYRNTVGAHKPVWSTGSYSLQGEGTNFADNPLDAEDYANYGRDDPRTTGRSTYLVEVEKTKEMTRWRDGYIKSPVPTPYENVQRVWEMSAKDGAVVMRQIKA